MARGLNDIAEALRRGQKYGRGCTLLIGAGCSKTANIPLAGEIVDHIRNSGMYNRVYELALQRAKSERPDAVVPTYGHCMEEMDRGDQRDLLRGYIKDAKLNWAHAGIASLVKHGYVDRILTTNFDPLIARACAVFNEIPAVYDLTMSTMRRFDDLPDKAIFHLHGQQNGFSLLNSPSELADHKKNIKPLIERVRETRTWIVCGYSGLNDPLFELIEDCVRYEHGLYWIGREDAPAPHLKDLLGPNADKGGHYVEFEGADEFFIRLCHVLEIADFQFMHRPLDHIEELLGQFVEFPNAATDHGIDLLNSAKTSINKYKALLSNVSAQESADQKIAEIIATQGFVSALSTVSENPTLSASLSPDMRAWLIFMEGFWITQKVKDTNEPEKSLELLQKSCEKFAFALAIKPDKHEALYNWGNSLVAQAQLSKDEDARRLWEEAGKKYSAALDISPNLDAALNNWGNTLSALARYSPYEEALVFWSAAREKFIAALEIKGDKHETFYNWANAICSQAKRSNHEDAKKLWIEAGEKYSAALAIKPTLYEALNNWGNALNNQANLNQGDESNRLWTEAASKFVTAHSIKPERHEPLTNWANALAAQAQRSTGVKAHKLWAEVRDKYAAALAIKPDNQEILIGWSSSLVFLAHHNTGFERQKLLTEAYDKASLAEKIAPGEGAYNLACIHAMRGELDSMTHWLGRSHAAAKLPTREQIAEDHDFDGVRDTPEFKAWLTTVIWKDIKTEGME